MKAIDVRNLVKRFGTKTVVDNVTLSVEEGEISGFLGPNGSGKTTTIRVMCGLLTPDEGEGTVLGYDLRADQLKIKRQVGYMTQEIQLLHRSDHRRKSLFRGAALRIVSSENLRARHAGQARPNLTAPSARRPLVRRLETATGARSLHHAQAEASVA